MGQDSFLYQFLFYTWRLWLIIFIAIAVAVVAYMRSAKQAKEAQRKNREALDLESKQGKRRSQEMRASQAKKERRNKSSEPVDAPPLEEDFVTAIGGSIFDDGELFPDDDDDDPLTELYAARKESEQAQTQPEDDDDEPAVDLASLLTGMVDEPEEPKEYHAISSDPVAVKLVTGTMAIGQELLSIFRDERDGRLLVQIENQGYRTLENDAAAKKTFTEIMQELSGLILREDESPPETVDVSGIEFNKMLTTPLNVQISSGGDTKAREMISILRDSADNHLIIQVGNKGYRTLLGQDKVKTGFSKIMKELATAVTSPDDNPPVAPKKAKSVQKQEAVSGIFSELEDEDPEPKDKKDAPLPGDIRMPKLDDLPDAYKVDRFGRVKVNKVSLEEKVEEINIAQAIEDYLQYKIDQNPEFQNRGIHIRSGFGGAVKIDVDGASYDFVDEVAEPKAREFIQTAINEWQERH